MDMVLIGGLWTQPAIWDETVAALAERGHRGIPIALPGQGDGDASATLDDQVDAVLAAVDALEAPALVVGHSAACSIAWIVADRRPETVAGVALIGGFPSGDGESYASFFPVEDGVMPFPGWEPFEGPDAADLDAAARAALALEDTPVPAGVAHGIVRLADDRRFAVPVTLVCPEFSADDARGWIASGDVPELAAAASVAYADIPTGHWPQASAPAVLADALAEAARPATD